MKEYHFWADYSFNEDRTKKSQEGREDYGFWVAEKVE